MVYVGFDSFQILPMPFKHNAAHRPKIPKQKYRITNWAEYEAGLRQRGSITFWMSDEAVSGWYAARRTTPGGQQCYSDLAIETSLICGIVFDQPLRQTEGLMISLFELLYQRRLILTHMWNGPVSKVFPRESPSDGAVICPACQRGHRPLATMRSAMLIA